uniref:(California timema) hypothetical protein n=1 Tax=Timema californicum TaxID=61474 RepID=A0A7R9P3N8_TIMCA|nr:unnamed protein product [Timema californicum]
MGASYAIYARSLKRQVGFFVVALGITWGTTGLRRHRRNILYCLKRGVRGFEFHQRIVSVLFLNDFGAVDEFLELSTNYGPQADLRVESAAHPTEQELQANESSDVETAEPTPEPVPKKRKGVRKREEESKNKDQDFPCVNRHAPCNQHKDKINFSEQHNAHVIEAQKGYDSKIKDKISAKETENQTVLGFDLQQVLPCLLLSTNIVYYKRLLSVYTLTIRECSSMDSSECYMWQEATGDNEGNKVKWLKIRWLRYTPDFGVIQYKYSLDEVEPVKVLKLKIDVRGGRLSKQQPNLGETMITVVNRSYNQPFGINPLKTRDVLPMLSLMDQDCHDFYRKLPIFGRALEFDEIQEQFKEDN